MLIGFDLLSYPLSLRGKRRSERVAFVRRHRPRTLGLGAVVVAFEFIPIFGAVFLTTAVVGSVLIHQRVELASGDLDSPKPSEH